MSVIHWNGTVTGRHWGCDFTVQYEILVERYQKGKLFVLVVVNVRNVGDGGGKRSEIYSQSDQVTWRWISISIRLSMLRSWWGKSELFWLIKSPNCCVSNRDIQWELLREWFAQSWKRLALSTFSYNIERIFLGRKLVEIWHVWWIYKYSSLLVKKSEVNRAVSCDILSWLMWLSHWNG